MERHLSLIKTEYQELEKRVFPRFPFGSMFFKDNNDANSKHVFEVKDISLTGMQISFRDGTHQYKEGGPVKGNLQWRNNNIEITGKIQWVRGSSIGLSFNSSISFEESLRGFLSYENIVAHIKPLHKEEFGMELPNNLKYWLRSDGVLEVFIWEHSVHGISRFQVIMMDYFIEWEEGLGIKTGKVMTQRDLDTPLSLEDEFVFLIDEKIIDDKVEMVLGVIKKIKEEFLPHSVKEFLVYKLGG